MVDDAGNVLARRECPTDAPQGYAHALGNIRRMLDATAHETRSKITGIGIQLARCCRSRVNSAT
jgi:predicted NBD/HSP70 family sugar kinase